MQGCSNPLFIGWRFCDEEAVVPQQTDVIGLDKFPNNKNGYYDEVLTMDHMDEELQKADVVVNCIPPCLTELII